MGEDGDAGRSFNMLELGDASSRCRDGEVCYLDSRHNDMDESY